MSALIDWSTIGQIFGESLAAGVLIVGAFALGAKLIAVSSGTESSGGDSPGRNIGALALAGLCFLVALVAVGYGVYFTIDK